MGLYFSIGFLVTFIALVCFIFEVGTDYFDDQESIMVAAVLCVMSILIWPGILVIGGFYLLIRGVLWLFKRIQLG